jgi:hypothetical protein
MHRTNIGKKLRTLLVVTLSALLASSCYKATGGGWIPTSLTYPTGGDYAYFGFTAMCRDTTRSDGSLGVELYDGELEWHDGNVDFHGVAEPLVFAEFPGRCKDVRSLLVFKEMAFQGTYQPQPTGDDPGTFFVAVTDTGTPGGNGDSISVILEGGKYDMYENAGTLEGGNIQVF